MKKKREEIIIHRPVVWVTGASRGIGREIAKQFAFLGCEVCLSSRNQKRLETAAKEIIKLGGRAHVFPLDVKNQKSILFVVKQIQKKVGQVDVLINNAGITVFKTFIDTTLGEFNNIIQTNLNGPIECIKAVLPGMIKRKNGWIINIVSDAAIKTIEGSAAYTASKSGLLALGKILREEVRQFNIKVVNVLPGAASTDMWNPKMRKKYSYRMMKAKSVAEAILSVYQMPDDVVVDEIVVRPVLGDLS